MLPEGIFTGQIRHRRFAPRLHQFSYPFAMLCIDLDRVDETLAQHPWWSKERFNLMSFCRRDFLDHPQQDLKQATRDLIEEHCGYRFDGQVRLLTLFRSLGFYFNSVSFYFCYENEDLRFIVAEINNTPWNERHAYVLDVNKAKRQGQGLRFAFDKDFHVSPFMPMNLRYHWGFAPTEDQVIVHMNLLDEDQQERLFDATLRLKHQPFTRRSMTLLPLLYPLQGALMLSRIYVQALKLWIKKIPFFDHPQTTRDRRMP